MVKKVAERVETIILKLTKLAKVWGIESSFSMLQYSNGSAPSVTITLDDAIFEKLKWYRNWMKNQRNDLAFWALAKESNIIISFFRGKITIHGGTLDNQLIIIRDFLAEIETQPEDIWGL